MPHCTAQTWFMGELKKLKNYSVLEIGTRRWNPDKPTHHKDWEWFKGHGKYVMSDFMNGLDVDVVADLHELSKVFGEKKFDVIFAASVFEHLEKPWIAAQEILKVLKDKGMFFIQTHQTFPIHGYPNDYFRYTTEGLKSIFMDASELHAGYEFPCEITAERLNNKPCSNCFLNVVVGGRK